MSDLSFFSRLPEALERFEVATPETFEGQKGVFVAPANLDDVLAVFEGASLVVDLLTVCPKCDGIGHYQGIDGDFPEEPCPSCGGRGVVLSEQATERATEAFFDVSLNGGLLRRNDGALMPDWEAAIAAALWAALTGKDERHERPY